MLQNVIYIVTTVSTVTVFQVGLNCVKQLSFGRLHFQHDSGFLANLEA
jgi:hypothetical protein